MTAATEPLHRRRRVLTAVMLLLLHGLVAFILVVLALQIALTVGGPTTGRDELYRMGPALQLVVAGAVAPFGISALLIWLIGLASPSRVWFVPLVAILTSVVFCVVATLFLRAPAPIPGG
jgi:hypothetical protein